MRNQLLQLFTRVEINEATLLGASLFHGPALDKAWRDRCDDLARTVGRLASISSQDARSCSDRHSVPQKCCIMCMLPFVSHHCLQTVDPAYNLPSNVPLTLTSQAPIGSKLAYQLRILALEWDVCLHSHFLSIWLQRQAHCHSKTTFLLTAYLQITATFRPIFHLGQLHLAQFPTVNPPNSYFGTSRNATWQFHGWGKFAIPHTASCLQGRTVPTQWVLAVHTPDCLPWLYLDDEVVLSQHVLNDLIAHSFVSAGIPVTKEWIGISHSDGKFPGGMTLVPLARVLLLIVNFSPWAFTPNGIKR